MGHVGINADLIRQARPSNLLKGETEAELWAVIKNPDSTAIARRKAETKLVTSYYPLCAKMVNKYAKYGVDKETLLAGAYEGLARAIPDYDHTRGISFATYAFTKIRARLKEEVRGGSSVFRIGTNDLENFLLSNYSKIYKQIKMNHPDIEGDDLITLIAEKCIGERAQISDDLDKVKDGVKIFIGKRFRATSLDAPIKDDPDSATLHDLIPSSMPSPEKASLTQEKTSLRATFLAAAKEIFEENGWQRDWEILTARNLVNHFEKLPQLEVLGQEHGISRERIRQIEARAIDTLSVLGKIFKAGGVDAMKQAKLSRKNAKTALKTGDSKRAYTHVEAPIRFNAMQASLDPQLEALKATYFKTTNDRPENRQRNWNIYFLTKIQNPAMNKEEVAKTIGVSVAIVSNQIQLMHKQIMTIYDEMTQGKNSSASSSSVPQPIHGNDNSQHLMM